MLGMFTLVKMIQESKKRLNMNQ